MSEGVSAPLALNAGLKAARQHFLSMLPPDQHALADQRLALAGNDLIDALTALYGHVEGFSPWLATLFAQLGRQASLRPAELVALDIERENQPDWFVRQRMLGYSTYVDRFGGNLRGVAGRIGHLRALGVDYLHLLPFLRARSGDSDGGFAVASFEEVEPALGSMDDLQALARELRTAGISLCSDLVLNHVADQHPWAQQAIAGDPAMRAFFHVFPDRDLPDAYETTVGQVFPQSAPGNFTRVPGLGWTWTTFYPYQWDLNYAHPPVFAAMATALLGLANRGVEVFRLDSAPFLWKRLGTACVNEPEVHLLLAALRACTRLVAPGVLLKAEAIMPTTEVTGYFGRGALSGRECHLAYHTGLMAAAWAGLAEGSAQLLQQVMVDTPANPPGTGWITYVRCHDDIVWNVLREQVESSGGDFRARIGAAADFLEGRTPGSFARGAAFQSDGAGAAVHGSNGMTASLVGLPGDPLARPEPAALRRFALLHALAFWVGAVPLLYMGDELGQTNNEASEDAGRIAWDGRWLQRPVLSTAALDALAGGKGVPAATFAALRALTDVRRDPRWPAEQAVSVVEQPDTTLLLLRRGDDARALFHFGAAPLDLDLDALGMGAGWSDAWASGATATGADDGTRRLAPWGALWRMRD